MAKTINATPVATGEDARRIREAMRIDRPLNQERIEALRQAIALSKQTFTLVRETPAGIPPG